MNKTLLKLSIIFATVVLSCIIFEILLRGIIFPKRYKNIIEKAAECYDVDPNLIYAVIKQESSFYDKAISKSGAKGLMQIMDSTASEVAKDIFSINDQNYDIFDPYTNINIGTKYISELLTYFDGNYYLALAAYNAGLGRVSTWFNKPYNTYDSLLNVIENIEYYETKVYLEKVIKNYEWYVKLY